MACHDGNLAEVKLLDEKPHLIQTGGRRANIPLNDMRMVEIALKYQPNVLSKCVLPVDTPINQALWLLENGLNPSHPNWIGVTPLHECAKLGNTALAQLLLAHGANPNLIDDHFRETPQQWAPRFRSTP